MSTAILTKAADYRGEAAGSRFEKVGPPTEGFYIVAPELAEHWLANYGYEHQRKVRTYHVAGLADEMSRGRFRAKTQVNFCRIGNSYFNTNGQHTLHAIVRSGVPQTLCVVVAPVRTMQEVADDFARHDTHLTRRMHDSLVAHELHNELGVNSTNLQTITAACLHYAWSIGETSTASASQLTHDTKLQIVRRHGALAAKCVNFLAGNMNQSWLTRKTTMASMMYTFEHDAAIDFWTGVRDDDGLRANDPRKTLRDYLRLTVTVGSGHQASRTAGGKVAANHMLVKAIASAWNAHAARRELKMIKVNSATSEAVFDQIGRIRC